MLDLMNEWVIVRWEDSASMDGWRRVRQQDYSPMDCETVGLLVHSDDKSITLAATRGEEDSVCSVMTIPRACILSGPNILREQSGGGAENA